MEPFSLSRLFEQVNRVIFNQGASQESGEGLRIIDEKPVKPRVILYRDCDRRGRKVLFDSENVTDEGVYLVQKDAKFLKQTLGEFAFGSVSLNFIDTFRFSRIGEENVWAYNWNHGDFRQAVRLSPTRNSSSGYSSSLPLITLNKSPSNHSSSSTHSSLGQYYKTSFAILILLKEFQSESSIVESTLLTLKTLITRNYLKPDFPITLKSFSNSFSKDLSVFKFNLMKKPLKSLILPSFTCKLLPQLINLLGSNSNPKLVLIGKVDQCERIFNLSELIRACIRKPHMIRNNSSGYHSDFEEERGISGGEDGKQNKFYLGESSDDEPSESRFALSSPDKSKLLGNYKTQEISPINVSIEFDKEDDKDGDKPPDSYYYVNSSQRFNPFISYQVFSSELSFDLIHSVCYPVICVNLLKNSLIAFNCEERLDKLLVWELVEETRKLSLLINDGDKISNFFSIKIDHFIQQIS